ncbi:hypothetical protein C6P41_003941 [Kluyveromyces marxianus]|uniref:Protein YIP4 n=2 Tax=Kluyveromyces marxianus TaxID=4911 RepID=W0T8R9_KLUMD|nr:protein YIP4 [Kluyveromyces marxianus DMKU3-1042]KAG0669316.1 hypothetical protein C6P43_003673 [Kluyveromyces marxianus]KAG0685716.1 hypothetical protein C6P41_003941 [Kluyveromyces marxianus]QGN15154.1 protein YIP4 [Kluyveromyces marxianus]BAO39438.1 protein YIP4 [Kluyveromyces marxianus DMKU3-1042]BAP70933.1 protein YIP4 [Kluyveromyces marxianus]
MDTVESDTIQPDFIEADDAPLRDNNNYGSTFSTSQRGTLDESIAATFKRDVHEINDKLKKVVYPHFPLGGPTAQDQHVFQGTDLWAPLCFIILYSLFLSKGRGKFSTFFITCWLLISTMATHLKLLNPHEPMSWMSYLSLAGYCVFPQVINSLACSIIFPLINEIPKVSLVRLVVLARIASFALCSSWAIVSMCKVSNSQTFVKKYPLALCLIILGWLPVIQ